MTNLDLQILHQYRQYFQTRIPRKTSHPQTSSLLNTVVRREVFRYFKFVDDENDLKNPYPCNKSSLTAFDIVSKAMAWKEEERMQKWNKYSVDALKAIKQARSQSISAIMGSNMDSTVSNLY